MEKRYWIAIFVFLIFSFLLDKWIVKSFEIIRNPLFDPFFLGLAFAGNAFIIFFFLTTILLWKDKKRRLIIPLWLSFLISVLASFFIKIMVQRPRPFEVGIVSVNSFLFEFLKNNFNVWNFSFPSFQALLVFSALPILERSFKRFYYIWFIFACLVGISRVYLGAHYLSDAISGAVIGYLIGMLVLWIEDKYKFGYKSIKWFYSTKRN